MKRSRDALEGPCDKQRRRQEYVSCKFCRIKKLKCDRQFPCSNCRARRLTCASSDGAANLQVTSSTSPATCEAATISDSSNPLNQSLDELKARLKRVEELLVAKDDDRPCNKESSTISYAHELPGKDLESSINMCKVEIDALEHQDLDSAFLTSDERIGHILSTSFLSFTTPTLRPGMDQPTLSLLPSRTQAIFLFDHYTDKILPFCHIVHTPTAKHMLETVYTQLENNQQPPLDQIALVSTILALGAYFAPPSSRVHFNGVEAKCFAYQWSFVAQRALLAANYIVKPTIETIQSIIMIAQNLLPNIGAMETSRVLMASALLGAQYLMLHRLDSPANKKRRENTQVDWINIEVKRRIWWHLASTAWMGAYLTGIGTYMINPKHMHVELPANVNDIDITTSGVYGRPLDDIPTDMTYCLYRTKLSVSIREIVDIANTAGYDADNLPYDLVLQFDKKINECIRNCARVGHLDDPKSSLKHKGAQSSFMRVMGEFCPQTKLARLHRPYLARGARDPKYAYSRMTCLRAARCVIELGKASCNPHEEFEPNRMWVVIHHFFVSVLVLVMDYCLNRDEPRVDERKAEIMEGFKWLEASQENSMLARGALRQLRNLLSHGVPKSDPDGEHHLSSLQANSGVARTAPQEFQNQTDDEHSSAMASDSHILNNHYSCPPMQGVIGSPSQQNWSELDFAPMENLDFALDLDESQFETLFKDIEGSEPTY